MKTAKLLMMKKVVSLHRAPIWNTNWSVKWVGDIAKNSAFLRRMMSLDRVQDLKQLTKATPEEPNKPKMISCRILEAVIVYQLVSCSNKNIKKSWRNLLERAITPSIAPSIQSITFLRTFLRVKRTPCSNWAMHNICSLKRETKNKP